MRPDCLPRAASRSPRVWVARGQHAVFRGHPAFSLPTHERGHLRFHACGAQNLCSAHADQAASLSVVRKAGLDRDRTKGVWQAALVAHGTSIRRHLGADRPELSAKEGTAQAQWLLDFLGIRISLVIAVGMEYPPKALPPGLDPRAAAVLREIVEQYVGTGEPVGSRTLARRLPIALSPATIRNVMADLTDAGLLFAPHTSAGRLPTERGLRLFVDGLLQFGDLADDERDSISKQLGAHGRSLHDTLADASAMLSGLSQAAGMVLAPKFDGAIKHIEFALLGSGRALVILVAADGQVENRVIEIPPGLPPSALTEAANYLNARAAGRTLVELRRRVAEEMATDRGQLDLLAAGVVEAGLATWTSAGRGRFADCARTGQAVGRRDPDRQPCRHPDPVRTAGNTGNHDAPAGAGRAIRRGAHLHRRRERAVRHLRCGR